MAKAGSDVLRLQWTGGLNTSLDAAFIGESEIADMENAVTRDGTARLDRRYILRSQYSEDAISPHGSGYGKYGTGALSEQYVAVLGNRLYQMDLATPNYNWVEVLGTGELPEAEEFYFAQFADYLYMASDSLGMARKRLAAGSDGTGDYELLYVPTAPSTAPTAPTTSASSSSTFLGSSSAVTGFGGANYNATTGAYEWYSGAGDTTLEITFDTSPDCRPDWSRRDVILQTFQTYTTAPFSITITDSSGASVQAIRWLRVSPAGNYSQVWAYRLQNIARSNRDQITKITYSYNNPVSQQVIKVFPPVAYGVWLSLESTADPKENYPTFPVLQYAYTYYNEATGFESLPSPTLTIPSVQQLWYGDWRAVTGAASAEDGVSHVRFYRVMDEGGATVYYRLGQVANAGTPSVTDYYPVDEVRAFATYTPSDVPISGVTAIAAWQNRLVVAADRKVFISRDSDPTAFTDIGRDVDVFDASRAVTFFPDDKQSETIYGLASTDTLYIVTDRSVRALFGSTPDNWRLVQMAGEEGAVGPRAWAAYRNGVLVLTPSGRLLYYQLGLSEPVDVGANLRPRMGNPGLKDIAIFDAVVGVRTDGEMQVSDPDGNYFLRDVEGRWRKGRYTHGVHSLLFNTGQPTRWMGWNGKLYETGEDGYLTDGGTHGLNGTEVVWSVTTRAYQIPRSRTASVFWGDASDTIRNEGSGVVVDYPKLTAITSRGTSSPHRKRLGKRNQQLGVTDSGEEIQFVLEGDKDTVLRDVRVKLDVLDPSRSN